MMINQKNVCDKVYGDFIITEPVIIELMESKSIQRLKGINQAGAAQFVVEGRNISRYDHSVGVMLLLKILGASLEEQIAGLLHDLSHTAFSHVTDYLHQDSKQSYHESIFESLFTNSEIPHILEKHNVNSKHILNTHNFSLLEQPIPDLCADRIDYTLRDATVYGFIQNTKNIVDSLIIINGKIVFKDLINATNFAKIFIDTDVKYRSNPKELLASQILADTLKFAIKVGVIIEADLLKSDKYLIDKLKNSKEKLIVFNMKKLNFDLTVIEDKNNYEYYIKHKIRYVDPIYQTLSGELIKASTSDSDLKNYITQYIQNMEKGHYLRTGTY